MKPILEKIKAKVGTIAPQIQTPAEKLNSSLGAPQMMAKGGATPQPTTGPKLKESVIAA